MLGALFRAVKSWFTRFGNPPRRPPVPMVRAGFTPPPDVDWVEHPVVVLNSRVLLYHHGAFGIGKTGRYDQSDPEYLCSDHYLIVEDSEAHMTRHWVSSSSWRIVPMMMGKPIGTEFTYHGLKGPQEYKLLAVHVPRDSRTFRLAELPPVSPEAS